MIAQAITNLFGGYSNRDGQDLIVEDRVERLPTEAEQELIDAETLRLETEATANAYRQQRAEEYAPLAEQFDMQYHDVQDGTETWLNHIKEVKAKYPKDSE
jgi:hypothetical protein